MPRVPILLDDFWTERRATVLRWHEPLVGGLGISLDVWAGLVDFRDGSWFAQVDGGFDDNLTLVSVDAPGCERRAFALSERALDAGNVSTLLGELGCWQLTPQVLATLGVSSADRIPVPHPGVRGFVHLHDDFIFTLWLPGPGLLEDATRLILRVHQHYLGVDLSEGQESRAIEQLLATLRRTRSIELRSEPDERRIRVSHDVPVDGWLNRLFRRMRRYDEFVHLDQL